MPRSPLHPLLLPLALGLLALPLGPRQARSQDGLPQLGPTPRPADSAGPSEPTRREKELLERIRQLKTPRWRAFGACRYDWGAWRLLENGVRTTPIECGQPPQKGLVAVHCDSLMMNRRFGDGAWEEWRLPRSLQDAPQQGGEDLMVASLCANARPAPPAPAKPEPPPQPAPAVKTPQPVKPSNPSKTQPSSKSAPPVRAAVPPVTKP